METAEVIRYFQDALIAVRSYAKLASPELGDEVLNELRIAIKLRMEDALNKTRYHFLPQYAEHSYTRLTKDIYNLASFDWPTMPQKAKEDFFKVVEEMVDDMLPKKA
jgi:hypothetical protein